jgi:signal transduction histidine kinase/CheY-like chemotaxis protein
MRPEFLLLAVCAASAGVLHFSLRYRSLRGELLQCHEQLRRLLRRTPAAPGSPPALKLRNPCVQQLWMLIRNLTRQVQNAAEEDASLLHLIRLGGKIAGVSDEASAAARAVGELLLQQAGPVVRAVVIGRRISSSAAVTLEYSSSLIGSRSQQAFLSLFDRLLDHTPGNWGFHFPARGSSEDFSAFGIGRTLRVPLRNEEGICGVLWLGFSATNGELDEETLDRVNALAEYCASSFGTAERVQKKVAERDQQRDFLIGMSHDLRAPGTSALYSLRDLLSETLGPLSPEQRLRLEIVENSLVDQLDILGDILDYTKHQRGLLSTHPEDLALAPLLTRLCETFSATARQRGIRFECTEIPDIHLHFDQRHLKRIVSNLVSNALKYTDNGFVRLDAVVNGETLELRVSDSGCGIPEKEQHLLFREFSRLSNGQRKQGAGLGLAVAHALAGLNRAELHYQPRPGGGSMFLLTSCCWKRTAGPVKTDADARPLGSILVIDDDPATCRMMARYLDGLAGEVRLAGSLEQAYRQVEEKIPDGIISDYVLGSSSVADFFSYLTSHQLHIPTIVVSGSADRICLDKLESAPSVLILEKPVDRETLRASIIKRFSRPPAM